MARKRENRNEKGGKFTHKVLQLSEIQSIDLLFDFFNMLYLMQTFDRNRRNSVCDIDIFSELSDWVCNDYLYFTLYTKSGILTSWYSIQVFQRQLQCHLRLLVAVICKFCQKLIRKHCWILEKIGILVFRLLTVCVFLRLLWRHQCRRNSDFLLFG